MEDIKGAKALYDLDIIPEREQVLQLNDNNKRSGRLYELSQHPERDSKTSLRNLSVQNPQHLCPQAGEHHCLLHLHLESQLKHYIWKDTSVQELDIDEEDTEETKKSLPKSRHNRIHISEVVEHKHRWFSMKPLIQITISAVSTAASVSVMAIITRVLLFIKSRKAKNHCDTETKSLSVRLDRLRTFAEGKLATPPAPSKKVNMRMPSPPTHGPSAYVHSKMNYDPPRAQ